MATAYLGRGLQGVADIDTATAISAEYPAATVNSIRTSGYATTGVGAGVYVSDALATSGLAAAHPRFCKQSLDGRYWRLLPEPWISVCSCGAIGNNSADDYPAIQAAIDYGLSYGGATVYFPAGTYKVNTTPTITHGKGLNLLGEGPDRSIISAGAIPAMATVGYWRSRVTGIGFWCDGNATGGAFQLDGETNGSFGSQGINFTNCYFFGNYSSKHTFTINLIAGGSGQGSENVWIGCGFAGTTRTSGSALLMCNGGNALNNTLLGCNFQSFITGVLVYGGNVDILHCGFQSAAGYDQIANGGADVDNSGGTSGDTVTMTGCRTESLVIYNGGGATASISNFGQQRGSAFGWGAGVALTLNELVTGRTAAGNDKCYRVTTAGTTAGSAPVWPESGTVTDGSVVWTQLDYNVFNNVNGRISNGQMQLGQFGGARYTFIENVAVTRDDCFQSLQFRSNGEGPHFTDLRLGGVPPPGNPERPVKYGTTPNGLNTDIHVYNIGNRSLVSSAGEGGGTYHDLTLRRGGGGSAWNIQNWWETVGGWRCGEASFDDIFYGPAPDDGVMFFITDGTPGSAPLTGGGSGCLAIYENGAWGAVATGNGLYDTDYGDVVVSGSGTAMTIDTGAVSLAKMASVASGSVFYRTTAGSGAPEVQTLATLKTDLGLSGTNSGDQTSVSGNAGTATALQTSRDFSIAGGGITAAAIGFTGTANVILSASVDAGHITLARMANLAANSFIGNNTGSAATPLAMTGTQATALLDSFTTATKGLAPASGGGTTNFLRADGTWAVPAGGGGGSGDVVGPASTTDNGVARFDLATGKLIQSSLVSIDDSGNIDTPGFIKHGSIATPAAPSSGVASYSRSIAGRHLPHWIAPVGIATALQAGLHGNSVFLVSLSTAATAPTAFGGAVTTTGTKSQQQTIASANPWQATARMRFQSAGTAGSAGGMRTASTQWFRGSAAGFGGFFFRTQFGQNLNVNGAQCFVGMCASTAALATTAGAVAALVNTIGVGFDTTDANTGNWQLFRNDATGTATKVDLGTGAARNTTHGFDLVIFCPPGAATDIYVRVTNLHTGTMVLDTSYNTDIPAVNTALAMKAECNNGAVASAHNLELSKVYIEADY